MKVRQCAIAKVGKNLGKTSQNVKSGAREILPARSEGQQVKMKIRNTKNKKKSVVLLSRALRIEKNTKRKRRWKNFPRDPKALSI